MKEQEINHTKVFYDIVTNVQKGLWSEAAKLVNKHDYKAADLIHPNENCKDLNIHLQINEYDKIVCPHLENKNHIALLIELAYKIRNEETKELKIHERDVPKKPIKMKEQEQINDIKVFADIVNSINKGIWTDAAKLVNKYDYDAGRLIMLNEDAKDCDLYFETGEHDYSICPYLDNKNHIALLIELANDLKNKPINKTKELKIHEREIPKKPLTEQTNTNKLTDTQISLMIIISIAMIILGYIIGNSNS